MEALCIDRCTMIVLVVVLVLVLDIIPSSTKRTRKITTVEFSGLVASLLIH